MNKNGFLIIICSLLISATGIAQLRFEELPTDELVQQVPSPSKMLFKGSRMIFTSDPVLHYGFQHQVVYFMKWTSDSTFNLYPIRHITTNNSDLPRIKLRKKSRSSDDFFNLARFHDWYCADLGNGKYQLNSLEKTHNYFIFKEG